MPPDELTLLEVELKPLLVREGYPLRVSGSARLAYRIGQIPDRLRQMPGQLRRGVSRVARRLNS